MTTTIFINNRRIQLDPAQLIQSGGEGMVFGLDEETAVKLYHHPTPQHAAKLRHLLDSDLAVQLPPAVLGPTALAIDSNGTIIGFQMPRLPAGSLPIKKLSNPLFWQKNRLDVTAVLPLLQQIHVTITHLHRLNIVIGDLNDHNIFFTLSPQRPKVAHPFTLSFIDVDSYQFTHHPCPVAMPAFLDPTLYHVTDFSRQPYFTPLTDWYAFAVLLVKSLLQVHPYSGAHNNYKSLTTRAQAQISVFDQSVTYPQTARPPYTLSDDLRHAFHRIFDKGERFPFPALLLAAQHVNRLILQPTSYQLPAANNQQPRLLLAADGVIELVKVQPDGRIHAIVRENNCYKLVRLGLGGKLDEMVLFNGRPGYRFAMFENYLAVNPPQGGQLLILDVGGSQPQKVTMLETALFRETAVFAATHRHLYRIAGTWIMRGAVRDGMYVEDAIATAHRRQTRFWASPLTETLVGYHRIFAEYRFFLIHEGSSYDISISPLVQGESLEGTAVTFTNHTITIQRTINQRGQQQNHITVCDLRGQIQQTWFESANDDGVATAVVHHHPAGQLIQKASELKFVI
ncbi:MAG: hypothetical protein H6667_26625 [Ardenticatenaceae bacterium]|nr:hypothetical protein [Ardenticatenaceae bacterium]